MKKEGNNFKFTAIISLFVLSMFLAGCGNDVSTGSYKANFGNNAKDIALLDEYASIYGDLGQDGERRILEAFTTTEIVDFVPLDYVTKWSKDEQFINLWFIYDNFEEGDELIITWTYYGDWGEDIEPYDIVSLPLTTGEDYGRGMSTLEIPDDGWPVGNYQALISYEEEFSYSVSFEVYDGPTLKEKFFEYDGADLDSEEDLKDGELLDSEVIEDDLDIITDEYGQRFKKYQDTNWDIEFNYPEEYSYSVKEGDVIFESEDEDMYFVLSVLLTDQNGGSFSSYDDVYMDYRDQFGIWGEDDHMWSGCQLSDRVYTYLHQGFCINPRLDEEYWSNDFSMVRAGDYYYVLQFVYQHQSKIINDMIEIGKSFKTGRAEKNSYNQDDYL